MKPLAGAEMNVAQLFAQRVRSQPGAIAIETAAGARTTYGELAGRVAQLAGALRASGLRRGDRVAMWSENRVEYVVLELAAAQLGLIVACLNWRLSDEEQRHCIRLVEPALVIVSERYRDAWRRLGLGAEVGAAAPLDPRLRGDDGAPSGQPSSAVPLSPVIPAQAGIHGAPQALTLGAAFDDWCASATPAPIDEEVRPDDGLVILYTSGTTGLPKGALVSQRAMVNRAMVFAADYGIGREDGFVTWSPLFHMAATDHTLATLLFGGKVMISDGLDLPALCRWIADEKIGWLLAMPGMIEGLVEALRSRGTRAMGVKMVGAMADLVPLQQIADLSGAVNAPYLNTFGATETGLPPASACLLAPGELPESLSKRQSSWCLVRLVDAEGREVTDGTPGEMAIQGPTVFSGYWNNAKANAESFRGGWFHMGDVFVRHADGSLDFVDRLKYLIKTGGENVYPAEIERVLLAYPGIREAAVVRRSDAQWGEVPVAYVAVDGDAMDEAAMRAFCREHLAGYKVPKVFRRIGIGEFPRSSTGKIQRHELEKRG